MRLPWFRSSLPHHAVGCLLAALSIAAACPSAISQGVGYWHTSANRILDENNQQVRIQGINWYGFETSEQTPGGLYAQDYKTILQTTKSQGFNTIRLPLSSEMIEHPSSNLNIAFSNKHNVINADLSGLNSLQVLDAIVGYAGKIGLKVILDHHRSEAGNSAEENGLWFTREYPESAWIADWKTLADRYKDNPTVIGFDLHNEPHAVKGRGACWDCGTRDDWHRAAQRAGNAILAINPNLLIFVEGTDVYQSDSYWWGGNLEGVAKSPVMLSVPGRVVYSAHDYGPSEAKQSWFNSNTTSASLEAIWTKHWAYVSQQNIAPVWLAEFGTAQSADDLQSSVPGSQGQWFQSLTQFLKSDGNLNWSYWSLNGEDRYGLLDRDYQAANEVSAEAVLFPASTSASRRISSSSSAVASVSAVSGAGMALFWMVFAGSGVGLVFAAGKSTPDYEEYHETSDPVRRPNRTASLRDPGAKTANG